MKPACPSTPHRNAATSAVLASSASGTSATYAAKPCAARSSRTASPVARRARGWTTSDALDAVAEQAGQLAEQPGADDDVVRRVAADGDAGLVSHGCSSNRVDDLGGDVLGGAPGGVDAGTARRS